MVAALPLGEFEQLVLLAVLRAGDGVIQALHLVFGLFYALLVVAGIRGVSLHVFDLRRKMRERAVGPGAGAERLELRPD